MQPGWIPINFVTCEAGASSAFDPELIPDNQLAWLRNGRIRGGKQHTRPFLRQRMVLPQGLVQGGSYFSVQGGMFVMQINGRIYRLRIGNRDSDFSYEEIPLDFINSPVLPTAWMVETVGSLVIQDGQSNPIIYDGSTARRSDLAENEVPLGRMMAYGNGRLWVAIGANELVAGDIITNEFQSELKFTETGYFLGGGKFLFPTAITGLKFVPASGAAGYGSLAVFTQEQTYLIKADITSRDLWAQIPGFIQPLLLSTGSIGQYGIAEVNQDLYWRDADGGIRSIRSAIADETGGPGLTPMSREVSRITDFESVHRLVNSSAISFGNRLICTASPFINEFGKTSFRDLISLDFSPVSSMRGKSAPSYDGEWDGLLFDLLLTGKFGGTKRGFVVSTDYDGNNRLWEIMDSVGMEADTYYTCAGTSVLTESQVPMISEYPTRDWGNPAERKRLQRCDVYLSDIEGDVELEVYYRPDNYQKWTKWGDTISVCANTTDPEAASDATPHVWKNLMGQERPQIKTLTIDDEINNLTSYAKQVGFMFQIRTVLRGKAKIHQLTVWAQIINQTQFADRDLDDALCRDNDVTGNQIEYLIQPTACPPVLDYFVSGTSITSGTPILFGDVDEGFPESKLFRIENNSDISATISLLSIEPSDQGISLGTSILTPFSLNPGEHYEFHINAEYVNMGTALSVLTIESDEAASPFVSDVSADFIPAIGPGSLFWAQVGSTNAFVDPISNYVFMDFTFQFWAYVPSATPPQQFGRFVQNNFISGFAINSKSTRRICLEGGSANIGLDSPDNTYSYDTWEAWAFRRSGSSINILRNGIVVASTTKTPSTLNVFTSGGSIRFGNIGGTETSSMYVSDWRMWNIALSDAQILANYNTRLIGNETGLVAYYPLSEADSVFEDFTGSNVALSLIIGSLPSPPTPLLTWTPLTPPFV